MPAARWVLDEVGHPAMLFVDGVSSIASIEFEMDKWGVDLAVSGSQKGFMLPTGLGIVGVSQKALDQRPRNGFPKCFFDFDDMIKTNADGYFPYTPATTLLRGLRASLDMIFGEGLENVWARHHRLAEGCRRAVEAWGLTVCAKEPKWNSDTVSAIVVPEGYNANDVIQTAFRKYDLSLGAGLSKVAGKVYRIGHLGYMNELMVMQSLAGAELAMRDVGIPFQSGAGVGAAVEYYAATEQAPALAAE